MPFVFGLIGTGIGGVIVARIAKNKIDQEIDDTGRRLARAITEVFEERGWA